MGTVGGDWGWLRKGAGGGGSLLDVTRHTFVHAVLPSGRLVILKPKKCPPAPKVPAKPPKPPTASKPEPKGLPGCLVKKLAVSSAQAFFPTMGKGPGVGVGVGVDAGGASQACDTGPHTPKGPHLI